jgi:putative transcriptional regulator
MKNKIKVFRAIRGLRQEDLAREVSVSRQTIVAIETGKYDPSLDLAFKIARFFKVPVEEVFTYEA